MVERNSEWIQVASDLNEVNQSIKFLEVKKAKITKQLQELSEGVDSCGGAFEYKKIDRKGSVNYDLVKSIYDIDFELYRKPAICFWKMNLRNPIIIEDIK